MEKKVKVTGSRKSQPTKGSRKKQTKFTPPNLDEFLTEGRKKYVSYMDGARFYSMNYYSFVKLAKMAGANKKIKKKVVVDLDMVNAYIEENCKGGAEDVSEKEG